MPDTQSIAISPESRALLSRLRDPQPLVRAIAGALACQNELTVAHLIRDYVSFPRSGPASPAGLRTWTGSLRRSIRASQPVITGQGVRSGIGGNPTRRGVNYLAVHEFGATIPAHTVTATNARALCFLIAGKKIFRQSVKIPAVTLPARAPVSRAIRDRLADYGRAVSQTIVNTFAGI